MKRLTTAGQVIDALGGTAETARAIGTKPPNVSNWRAANRFPPTLYLVFVRLLRERRLTAPAGLWGMAEPKARAS